MACSTREGSRGVRRERGEWQNVHQRSGSTAFSLLINGLEACASNLKAGIDQVRPSTAANNLAMYLRRKKRRAKEDLELQTDLEKIDP